MSLSTAAYRQPADTLSGEQSSARLLVAGVAVPADLRSILHKRLRICGTIFTIAYGLILTTGPILLSKKEFESSSLMYYAAQAGAFVTALTATVILWRRSVSLPRLRLAELLLFGTVIAQGNYAINRDCLENGSLLKWLDRPAPIMYHYYALPSFAVIMAYGIFIPNTGRRCAAVVTVMAVLPVVTLLASGAATVAVWERDDLRAELLKNVWMLALWMGTGAAAAVYCSYRIETLRRDVSEARKVGQYVLRERLGGGGMGEVYRAEHALLRRPCAVKLIRADRAGDPAALARFEREVQVTATLAHPHIVRIYDYGRADDGTFYCVMEYLSGITLDELVRKHGPLPPGRVVALLRQLCSALSEAHGRGLTHRDVKPGNVIVRDCGRQADFATLLDFGLVLDPGTQDEKLTAVGMVAGTPAFMAPEQAGGDPVDHRADLYAVGAVGFYLLTGRAPFSAGSSMRTIAAVLTQPPPPFPGAPPDLAAVVLRCMSKPAADRYESADALDAALAACDCADWVPAPSDEPPAGAEGESTEETKSLALRAPAESEQEHGTP